MAVARHLPQIAVPVLGRKKKRAASPREEAVTASPPTKAPTPTGSTTSDTASAPTDPIEKIAVTLRRLDRALVGVVLLLAFFLGSFVARNSDVWMHLAAGRLVAEGQFPFGADPFAYTTDGVYWANHSWLADLGLYWVTLLGGPEHVGGIVAVVVKALLVVGLAGLMLTVRRRGQSLCLPTVCVAVALVCMAPRLVLLQSVELSYLFLGATLAVLAREGRSPAPSGASRLALLLGDGPERLYVLPPLFLLWVNCDAWFLLGPAAVALYLLGGPLWQWSGLSPTDRAERQSLLLTLGVGLAACVLSPHHIYAFTPPTELLPGWQFPIVAEQLAYYRLYFLSPFQRDYVFDANVGFSVAGVTYYVLFLLGLVSFGLHRRAGWRLSLWLGFALLSATNYRLIPFFAVVGGPIAALNLQDFLVARNAGEEVTLASRQWAQRGRELSLVVGVALLFTAWPGWLLTRPGNPQFGRHVGWGIEAEPSLVKAAGQFAKWRREEFRKDEHGISNRPEVGHYCAWFAPDEKGFFDNRLGLFSQTAADYADVLKHLTDPPTTAGPLAGILRERGIAYVTLYAETADALFQDPRVLPFLNDPDHWTLLYLDGRTFVFGWNEALVEGRLERLRYDFGARAFGTKRVEKAPAVGPGRPVQPPDWSTRYVHGSRPRPLGVDEAKVQLFLAERFAQQRFKERIESWQFGRAARTVGLAATADGAIASYIAVGLAPDAQLIDRHLASADPKSTASLVLLALRAARRAVAEEPDEPEGYLWLFEAVGRLADQEDLWANSRLPPALSPVNLLRKRPAGAPPPTPSLWMYGVGAVPPRPALRRIEELSAGNALVTLQPDAFNIHVRLNDRYRAMGYYDVAIDHLHRGVDAFNAHQRDQGEGRDPATRAGVDPAALTKSYKQLEKDLGQADEMLKALRAEWERQAGTVAPEDKARLAFERFGLAQEALTLLQQEKEKSPLSIPKTERYIYLMTTTGRSADLDVKSGAGLLQTYRLLAGGDLIEAGTSLDTLAAGQAPLPPQALTSSLALWTLGQMEPHVLPRSLAKLILGGRESGGALRFLTGRQAEVGQLLVARGLVALEEGNNVTAAGAFRAALEYAGSGTYFESRGVAVRYLELLDAHRHD